MMILTLADIVYSAEKTAESLHNTFGLLFHESQFASLFKRS